MSIFVVRQFGKSQGRKLRLKNQRRYVLTMRKPLQAMFFLLVLTLILSLGLACAEEKPLYIPMISKGFQHQFW